MSKQGGGTHRRGGRRYLGQMCVECVEAAIQWVSTRGGEIDRVSSHSGYDVGSLVDAAAEFIERGHSGLDEERWRQMWSPSGHVIPFEVFYLALLGAVEDSMESRAKWREERRSR